MKFIFCVIIIIIALHVPAYHFVNLVKSTFIYSLVMTFIDNDVFIACWYFYFIRHPYLAYLSGRNSVMSMERRPLRDLSRWLARKLYFRSSFWRSTPFVV